MKNTRSKLLSSITTLLVCFAMLLTSTFAWFTDTATTGLNRIESGNLDVEFYHTNSSVSDELITSLTKLFTVDTWEPGVVAQETIKVKNEGNLALKYKMAVNSLVPNVDYNFLVEANGTITNRSLLDALYVAVGDVANPRALTVSDGTPIKDFLSGNILNGQLLPDEEDEIKITIFWAVTDRDNDFNVNNGRTVTSLDGVAQNNLVIQFPITLVATQLTNESDSFDDQYDAGATFPFVAPESTTAVVETPTLPFYSDYNATNVIPVDPNEQLVETVTVTATGANTLELDVDYTYGANEVHKFTEVREKTYALPKGLSDVTVTHESETLTKCTTRAQYDAEADKAYFYDATSGVLYIKSSVYSKFTVTISHDFVAVVNGEGYNDIHEAIAQGGVVSVMKDIQLDKWIEITKSVTILGNGHTVKSLDKDSERVLNMAEQTEDINLVIKDWNMVGPTSGTYTRGISFWKNTGKVRVVMENCKLSANYYALNIAGENADIEVRAKNCTAIGGWAAVQTWSANSKMYFENCELIGTNDKTFNADGWNDFGTVVVNEDATDSYIELTNSKLSAIETTGNKQVIFDLRSNNSNIVMNNTQLTLEGDKAYAYVDKGENNKVIEDGNLINLKPIELDVSGLNIEGLNATGEVVVKKGDFEVTYDVADSDTEDWKSGSYSGRDYIYRGTIDNVHYVVDIDVSDNAYSDGYAVHLNQFIK